MRESHGRSRVLLQPAPQPSIGSAAVIVEHRGKRPQIADSAYIAPNAVVSGDVVIGEECRVLYGAVVTADAGAVELGAGCIVMEQALLRGRERNPCHVGDHVLIGPHAHLNGATLASEVFVATGASVFPGAQVGRAAELRIGSVVHANSVVGDEVVVPIGWIAAGDPAELFSPDRHEDLWETQREMDFPETVFGIPREDATMARISEHYVDLFGEHLNDRIVEE